MAEKKKKQRKILPPLEDLIGGSTANLVNEALKKVIPPSPSKTTGIAEEEKDKIAEVASAVYTTVDNTVITPISSMEVNTVDAAYDSERTKEKGKQFKFEYLDATHTSSEAKVYSVMYRECKRLNTTQHRFGLKELKEKTGLSDKTVRVSIHSLEDKLSIKTVAPSLGIYGRKFKVFWPKEILEARHKANIEIEPTTKRIIKKEGIAVSTAVATMLDTEESVTTVSKVKDSAVSAVKSTAHILNILNKDAFTKQKSSLNSIMAGDDSFFNHKNYVISLYKKYTGNNWREGDNKFYEKTKGTIPDIIEAGVISSVLRSKGKVKSFAYCEGAINEFSDNFPPGYLVYLREKWKKIKENAE